MSHINDPDMARQHDDLRRQLADRLGRLVAREYLSLQSPEGNVSIFADATLSSGKEKGIAGQSEQAIIRE
jgi:hypothetical protein